MVFKVVYRLILRILVYLYAIYVLKIKIKLGYISKRNSAIHKWHKNLKLSWRLERNHALSSRQEN